MENKKIDAIILGAGLTGLSCGYKLGMYKKNIIILEKNNYIGGLATSFEKDGFVFDVGPHRFHSKEQNLIDFVQNEINIPLIERKKITKLYFKNRYYEYPFKIEDLLKGLDLKIKIKSLYDFIYANFKKGIVKEDDSFEGYVKSRFGKTIYDIFFGPYTKKVWGIDPDDLDYTFAIQRIASKNLMDVVIKTIIQNTVLIRKYYHPHSPYKKSFYYPASGGVGLISERMKTRITEAGGRILANCIVKNIKREESRWVVQCEKDGKRNEFISDYLISTIPIDEIIRLIEGRDSYIYKMVRDNLIYRALVILYLVLNIENYSQNNWIYYCENDYPFNRISENKMFSPKNAPSGRTTLNIEITCFKDDEIFNMDKDDIFNICEDGLAKIGIPPEIIEDYFIKRFEYAYCIFKKGYNEYLNRALDYFNGLENFISCGRQGLFRYINMDYAIKMGIKTADFVQNRADRDNILNIGTEKLYLG